MVSSTSIVEIGMLCYVVYICTYKEREDSNDQITKIVVLSSKNRVLDTRGVSKAKNRTSFSETYCSKICDFTCTNIHNF